MSSMSASGLNVFVYLSGLAVSECEWYECECESECEWV